MKTQEFVGRVKSGMRVGVGEKVFEAKQKIKWRMLRSGGCYHKYVLVDREGNDGYRLAEDPESERFILVKVFESEIDELASEVEVEGRGFSFSYSEFCVAEEVWGEEIYRKGAMEIWWDYEAEDGSYLSLGNSLPGGEREDLIGRWVEPEEVQLMEDER